MLLLTSKKISMGRKIDISKSVTNWEWSNKLRLLVWKTLGAWWQEKEWAFCSRCLVNLSSALSVWVWCEKDLSLIIPAFFCFYLLFYIIGKQVTFFIYNVAPMQTYQFTWSGRKKNHIKLEYHCCDTHTHTRISRFVHPCWCYRSCQHCCDTTDTTVQKRLLNTIILSKTIYMK